ncbi:GNAT family N-acetyltransferase [Saccharophagus degradans]|uniref:GNAT family N-acetyltransferase n=1 Tax=Saccharophagus degradans TaxID=86304 RepID=UPI0024780DBE|nr:GNAT family N-acetyltransferase [Saccharophagus degradans]WGO98398.1 GNAT family N-acetyltransferase [Saccharophagus degradans]
MLQPVSARDKATMQVELTHNPSFELVKNYWSQLCEHTPGHAFLNECWITSWYKVVSKHHSPTLVVVKNFDSIVALAVIHTVKLRRRALFTRKVMFFNEIPTPPNDMVIEYNGILANPNIYTQAWTAILDCLKTELEWDEIKINKIDPEQSEAITNAASENGLIYFHEREDTSPIAVLDQAKDWQAVENFNLSSNRRRQVRKAKQLYEEKYGKLQIEVITDIADVDSFWNEMAHFHTAHWNEKGDAGAFANPVWCKFNRSMIADWLNGKHIQLTKYIAGNTCIGYLFNLRVEDRVYNIQCGFLYEEDNRLKPGFVCHHACMKMCHEIGVQYYYYLAGGEDYKVSLSSQIDKLNWFCLRKSNKPFIVEDSTVQIVRTLRNLLNTIGSKKIRA